jgi:hypothetical protein
MRDHLASACPVTPESSPSDSGECRVQSRRPSASRHPRGTGCIPLSGRLLQCRYRKVTAVWQLGHSDALSAQVPRDGCGSLPSRSPLMTAYYPDSRGDSNEAMNVAVSQRRWALRTGHTETSLRATSVVAEAAYALGDLETIGREASAGYQEAMSCGFRLLEIDFQVTLARAELALARPERAREWAAAAFRKSTDPGCNYWWGRTAAAECLSASGVGELSRHHDEIGQTRQRMPDPASMSALLSHRVMGDFRRNR